VSGKPILPIELERLRMELAGAPMPAPKRGKLKARVYRPDIGIPQAALPVVEAHAPKPTPVAASPAGPTAAPQPLDPAEAERKASLEAAYAAMSGQNHYAFLGLETKADDGAVRSAYMRRARDLHPDSIAGGNLATHTDIVDKVDALFKRLQEAHGILSNPDSRAAYDRQIASGGTGAPEKGKKVRRPEEAAVLYGKAEHLVKKKDWLSAETHYRTALELDGEDPRIAVGLAWSIFMNPDRKESERAQEASKRLKDALTKFKTADAAFKLGVVLRALNDEEGAQRHFQTALKLDPKHIEAARERRLFEMRGQKAAEDKEAEKGLFGRMFKR
jgi:curved DNA-binding protein CbpA